MTGPEAKLELLAELREMICEDDNELCGWVDEQERIANAEACELSAKKEAAK